MSDKVSCEIVKDLLPQYIENLLSNDGRKLVSEHIDNCINCKKEYENISATLNIDAVDKVNFNYLKKISTKFLLILILSLVVLIVSSILLVFYTEPNYTEGIITLLFLGFALIAIVIKFVIPLVGLVYGIIYLKEKKNKIFIILIFLCSVWLFISVFIYISNLINY